MTAPDGRKWEGDSKLRVMILESDERVPATIALERIMAVLDEPNTDDLLDDLQEIAGGTKHPSKEGDTVNRLRAFLSDPLTVALQDPGTAAAMRVLLEELPGLMQLDGEWTTGSGDHWSREVRNGNSGVYWCGNSSGQAWANKLCKILHILSLAAQAKRDAEKEEK